VSAKSDTSGGSLEGGEGGEGVDVVISVNGSSAYIVDVYGSANIVHSFFSKSDVISVIRTSLVYVTSSATGASCHSSPSFTVIGSPAGVNSVTPVIELNVCGAPPTANVTSACP